jgi:dolichol-phosphate mannosyltransferase
MNRVVPADKSISIIVPAYNESGNILAGLAAMVEAGEKMSDGYEIIVVNDCSKDDTLKKAQSFALSNKNIKVVDSPVNLGFGGAFHEGLRNAKKSYSVMVCADNCISGDELFKILSKTGQADIVVPYIANTEVRGFGRRFLSTLFVKILNFLFRLDLKYYNGHNVFPTGAIQHTDFTPGFAFSAEIMVRLLTSGYTYCQVPMIVQSRVKGETKAFKIKNIILTIQTILGLIGEVYFFRARKNLEHDKNI